MSYEKINFKNREVEKPLTFKKHVNDDGTITLEPKPGTIVEPGTPLLADHFNHMDDGIYKAHEEIDNLKLSGIERNKELVANLNSKKVSATTNDSLKTNIAKVKDIKLGSGNAVTSDVLESKTFSSSQGTDLTGTMPNNGVLSKTITTQGGTQKISPGYYEGGEVKAQFNNLTPSNIKDGINVGGVVGKLAIPLSLIFEDAEFLQRYEVDEIEIPKESHSKAIYGVDGKGLDMSKHDIILINVITSQYNDYAISSLSLGSTDNYARINIGANISEDFSYIRKELIFMHSKYDSSSWNAHSISTAKYSSGRVEISSGRSAGNISVTPSTNMPIYLHSRYHLPRVYYGYVIEIYGLKL